MKKALVDRQQHGQKCQRNGGAGQGQQGPAAISQDVSDNQGGQLEHCGIDGIAAICFTVECDRA